MLMNPMFSIIIPAYNSENHIRKGLESIRTQSYRNYELIVVCDNCTDNTEQIAKEYGAVTECVIYGKDGLTRDKGIEMAHGKWVLFMDDDDWFIHEFVFKQLADELTDELDLLAFGYLCNGKGYIRPEEENIFKPTVGHVWSNCWKRSVIGDARFGDATFCSDTYFLRAMKDKVKSIEIWDMPIYYYNFMRPGSQTDLFVQGKIIESPIAR